MTSIYAIQKEMHEASGFEGRRLLCVTFAVAAERSGEAGQLPLKKHYTKRFSETLAKLDTDGALDVIGFIADQKGIMPEPYPDF